MPQSARRKRAKRERKPIDPDRLLYTRREAARLLGISTTTIIRLQNTNRLKSLKLGPNKHHLVMFRAADIRAFAGVAD